MNSVCTVLHGIYVSLALCLAAQSSAVRTRFMSTVFEEAAETHRFYPVVVMYMFRGEGLG